MPMAWRRPRQTAAGGPRRVSGTRFSPLLPGRLPSPPALGRRRERRPIIFSKTSSGVVESGFSPWIISQLSFLRRGRRHRGGNRGRFLQSEEEWTFPSCLASFVGWEASFSFSLSGREPCMGAA